MEKLENIDKNMVVQAKVEEEGVAWYDPQKPPFSIHGLMYLDGMYRRMPDEVAATVSPGVRKLSGRTTGGRVRFRTDSPFVAIRAKMDLIQITSPNSSRSGVQGFDLYMGQRHIKAFGPPADMVDGYESSIDLPEKGMQEITVFFPLYAGVYTLEIGLQEGCVLEAAEPYPNKKPIVFYGSSITHGSAASRAGNCYTNMVCRELGRDIWNLGFSGNAKGEVAIAQYIAGLEMECFVYDYDHNAPNVEHLENTHERMFRMVRAANPDIPILMMCRPRFAVSEDTRRRMEVIRRTYENAKAAGDENVYLLTGPELMAIAGYDGMVDGTHPNDLGFFSMAQAVLKVLKPLF